MRRTAKVAAVSVSTLIALAGCGSASRTGTSGVTTPSPPVTAPAGTSAPSSTLPAAGALSVVEQTDLNLIHEQERAGLDALTVLAARYPGVPVFTNLAGSQKTQLATVTAMMARYAMADPSSGLAAGRYSDPSVQQLYDAMVATTSVDHALDAVEHFEEQNLASLRTAASRTTRADLATMYTNLEQASISHISACNDAAQHSANQG